jgi:penicillin-binding protein 1A
MAGAALPVWVKHMREVLKDFPESVVAAPVGITTAFISKEDGKLADSQDPDGFWEYFKIGTEPRRSGEAVVRQGEVPVRSVSVETDTDTEAEDLF